MRVLIIDYDKNVGGTAVAALETMGHENVAFENGNSALRLLGSGSFDVVFLGLEGGNGLDLLREILKRDSRLPIVVFTAFAEIATAIEAIRQGAVDYLFKPFTPDQINHALDNILKTRRLERRVAELESYLNLPVAGLNRQNGIQLGAKVSLADLESEHIARVMAQTPTLEEAARILGIDPATLYRKRKRMSLVQNGSL